MSRAGGLVTRHTRGVVELDLLRRACEVGVVRPWAGAWAGGAGVLLRRCALTSASAPPPHPFGTSGPWALRPRLRHTTQHAVFFLQFRITAIYVMLSTCVKSCPRVPLHAASLWALTLSTDLTFPLLYTGDDAAGTPSDRPVRTPDSDPMAC